MIYIQMKWGYMHLSKYRQSLILSQIFKTVQCSFRFHFNSIDSLNNTMFKRYIYHEIRIYVANKHTHARINIFI